MKNSMHLDAGKHPFGVAAKTPQPGMATMQGVTGKVGGTSKPGQTANASMRSKPSKK